MPLYRKAIRIQGSMKEYRNTRGNSDYLVMLTIKFVGKLFGDRTIITQI